jgi:hypothetical protein
MGIFTPIRLDRLQTSLVAQFTRALELQTPAPEVHWALTGPSHEQLPVSTVVLRMIGGPSPFIRSRRRATLLNPSSSIDITVTSVVVGQMYGLHLNEFLYSTAGLGGDTVTTIRDRLSALVSVDLVEPVTPSDVGVDALRLTADFNGAMRSLRIVGPMTSSANVVSDQSVGVVEGQNTMLVNVQAYTKNREPHNGAPALTSICYAALQTESYINALDCAGVAVQTKGTPTDLAAVVGARWESRSSFDLALAMQAAWVEDVERIESLSLTTTFSGITTEQIISV